MPPAPTTAPLPPARLAAAATWSRLHTFLAVIDTGSVRAASDQLHVTPPAVSAAVGALERELGAALFVKQGRGITATAAGQTLAGYARTMLGLLDEAAIAVRDTERSHLRLGAVATAAEFVLPPLLASFATTHPQVELSLTVAPRDALVASLQHHEIDLLLAGRPPRGPGLVTRGRRPTRLVVVAAPAVAASTTDPAQATWLLRSAGSGTLSATHEVMSTFAAPPRTLTLGTAGAVVAAARAGLGLTLVHEDAVTDELASGRLALVPLAGTPLDRPWHLVSNRTLPAVARAFVTHVRAMDAVGTHAFGPAR